MISILHMLRSYAGTIRRVFRSDPFVISNRNLIVNDCPVSTALFDFALAHLVLQGECKLFLQIGANTGKGSHDRRDFIIQHRVNSVLVEPQPDVFNQLKANYKSADSVRVIHAAIDRTSGSRDIYRLSEDSNRFHRNGGRFGTGIASFDRAHVWKYFVQNSTPEGLKADPSAIVERFPVKCMTFAELKDTAGFDRVDVLMIDTEGFDFEILKLVEYDSQWPALIMYEYKHLGRDAAASWEFLANKKYRMVNSPKSGDTIAIHESVLTS